MMKAYGGIWLAATMLVATAIGGCVTEDFMDVGGHVLGENGYMAFGFAYDGQGVKAIPGHIWIDADEGSNTGEAFATATLDGLEIEAHFDHFMGSSDFHSGGIAAGLVEHGGSGVGDASIPAVRLALAAWGHSTLGIDGKVLSDPIGGDDQWTAHFMVIENGVRDDETGEIHNADGSGTYDPSSPGDGMTHEGDLEVHLVLKSDAPEGNSTTQTFTFSNPQPINTASYANRHAFDAVPGSDVSLDISVTGTVPMAPGTTLTFTVTDPAGNEMDSATVVGGDSSSITFSPTLPGEYSIDVSGQGAGASYSIEGSIAYTPIVIYMWWEDVLLGDEAAQRADEIGASSHSH